jgi:hypothetical protein
MEDDLYTSIHAIECYIRYTGQHEIIRQLDIMIASDLPSDLIVEKLNLILFAADSQEE